MKGEEKAGLCEDIVSEDIDIIFGETEIEKFVAFRQPNFSCLFGKCYICQFF